MFAFSRLFSHEIYPNVEIYVKYMFFTERYRFGYDRESPRSSHLGARALTVVLSRASHEPVFADSSRVNVSERWNRLSYLDRGGALSPCVCPGGASLPGFS